MKKTILAASTALLALALVSCAEEPEVTLPVERLYEVICNAPSGNGYHLSVDKEQAAYLELVTVTARIDIPLHYVASVTYNGIEATKGDGDTWTFYMPNEDVTVTMVDGEYETVMSDGGISLSEDNPTTIAVADPEDGFTEWEDYADSIYEFSFGLSLWQMHMVSEERTYVISTEQDVIPNDALRIEYRNRNNSSEIVGGTIQIDSTQISVGTTYIEMHLVSGNNISRNGTVGFILNVVGPKQIPIETMDVALDVSIASTPNDIDEARGIWLSIFDYDYLYGEPDIEGWTGPSYIRYENVQEGRKTLTLKKNHGYSVQAWYYNTDSTYPLALVIEDSGDSAYTLEDGNLTFVDVPTNPIEIDIRLP